MNRLFVSGQDPNPSTTTVGIISREYTYMVFLIQGFPPENQNIPSFKLSYINNDQLSQKIFNFRIVLLEKNHTLIVKSFIINLVVENL